MNILLVDPRWPDRIPVGFIPQLRGNPETVEFSADVPPAVQAQYQAVITPVAEQLLITSDATDPRISATALVLRVPREPTAGGPPLSEPTADGVAPGAPQPTDPVTQAQQVMRKALEIGEWEQTQTHESLVPYLHEETAELSHAITSGAGDAELKAELGDVLLQVLFHSEIAARRGAFDFSDVAASFVGKMRRRSPYLFDGTVAVVPVAEQDRLWQLGKRLGDHMDDQPNEHPDTKNQR